MKVLFYSHTGEVSGAENVLLLLLEKLDRTRFAPTAVCPSEGGLAGRLRQLDVPCRTVRPLEARFTLNPAVLARYLVSFFRTALELRREMRAGAPDLIHANSIRAGLVATAATAGTAIPVSWHLQDELKPHPISTAVRLFALLTAGRVRLMPVSKATGESFRGRLLGTFGKKIPLRVVHNAIEPKRFRPDPAGAARVRKEFGLPPEAFVAGIVGQITPRKGQLELVRTFARVLEKLPDARLLIVGRPMFNRDHEYLARIEETVRESGLSERVFLTGQRSDVPAVMQALDALVVNSSSEALVVVALEAMAAGTPVIATDTGGTREMIVDGRNGRLVPFGDEEKLADALAELGRDPELRRKFAAGGKRIVAERFGAERFIADVGEFFREAARSGRTTPAPAEPEELKNYV